MRIFEWIISTIICFLKFIIGFMLVMGAFLVEAMWLGFCFGTVIVGILMLLFMPEILFAPFIIIMATGGALMENSDC